MSATTLYYKMDIVALLIITQRSIDILNYVMLMEIMYRLLLIIVSVILYRELTE